MENAIAIFKKIEGVINFMIRKIICSHYESYLKKKFKIESAGDLLEENFKNDYKIKGISIREVARIHRNGFAVSDWRLLKLNHKNYMEYMSNVTYYKMHPINGIYSKWIDDKLTLKYLCYGTHLDKYMPKYYYQISQFGEIFGLMDCMNPNEKSTAEDIVALLELKGVLAIKLMAGAIGKGFYKAEYREERYFLNGKDISRVEMKKILENLKGYLITEYFYPHKNLAEYCPDTVNTIRYLYGNINREYKLLKAYVRLGTNKSGFVENYNAGGILCFLNENGEFKEGHSADLVYFRDNIVEEHPDTGKKLKGKIPLWNDIVKASKEFSDYFPQLTYLGFDFVVTNRNEVKILEINSLTSLDALQLDGSIKGTVAGDFFDFRLKKGSL